MLVWFAVGNLLLCLFIFRGGLWGGALLAPLDILPAVCPNYHFMDPASSGVPANHYLVDQVTYDLPLQQTIYDAYRRGEIPWWDPYALAGHPLLADVDSNGADLVRIALYLTVSPFALAYNWTLIAHFVAGGLGMLLLLRHFGFPVATSVLLALAFEFAGCQSRYLAAPWVQASFLYYPFLWLMWHIWFRRAAWWSMATAAALIAAILVAGNLQSHAYLALFAAAVLSGYGGTTLQCWKKIFLVVLISSLGGVLLAAPILLGQVELFTLRTQSISRPWSPLALLNGPASLAAVYPWLLGTFRTLDLSKLIHGDLDGFVIYIGSAAFLLAALGARRQGMDEELQPARRTALWLAGTYLLIVATPLKSYLYQRSACLAVLGMTVLAAMGTTALERTRAPSVTTGRLVAVLTVVVALSLTLASTVIYPRYLPQVRQMVTARSGQSPGYETAYALRQFQINNLANEVSCKNPETLFAVLGLLGFAAVCIRPELRRRRMAVPLLLAVNLVPLALYTQRFVPVQPMAAWRKLTAEATEQQRVAALLQPERKRLMETVGAPFDRLYPHMLGHLFQVRTVHGYSTLIPESFHLLTTEQLQQYRPHLCDYFYVPGSQERPAGTLIKNHSSGSARFQWQPPTERDIRIEKETLNTIHLAIAPGPAADLIRTDTYYPGWSARVGQRSLPVARVAPFFSKIAISPEQQVLVLHYEPTHLRLGITLTVSGVIALAAYTVALWRRSRRPAEKELRPSC